MTRTGFTFTVTVIVTVNGAIPSEQEADLRYTLDQLTVEAGRVLGQVAPAQPNGQVSAVPDGRTVRYYASLGLLDPPIEVRGRRRLYGHRHVLQVVAIKVLQAQGRSLQQIQRELTGRHDQELKTIITPRSIRFWATPPASTPTPASTRLPPGQPRPGGPDRWAPPPGLDPLAVRLAPDITLVINPERPVTTDDHELVRQAGVELVNRLRHLGLAGGSSGDHGDDAVDDHPHPTTPEAP